MNQLIHSDNLDFFNQLALTGSSIKFDLVYLDPPFYTQRVFKTQSARLTPSEIGFSDVWHDTDLSSEQIALTQIAPRLTSLFISWNDNIIPKSAITYLTHLAIRIAHCHERISDRGNLFLHCDPTMSHYLKVICDYLFGYGHFRNEIVWRYSTGGAGKRVLAKKHDIIFWYSKSKTGSIFHPERIPEPRAEKALLRAQNPKGARIDPDNTTKLPSDVWEIPALNPMAIERSGYPTQKPEALLERIILGWSEPESIILDPCCGSGTTCIVARKLGRNWIGIDSSPVAIEVASLRLK